MTSVRHYINQSTHQEWKHNTILKFMSKILFYRSRSAPIPRTLSPAQSQKQSSIRNISADVYSFRVPVTSGFESSNLRLSLFPSPPSSSRPSVTVLRDKPPNRSLSNPYTYVAPRVPADEDYSYKPGESAVYYSTGNAAKTLGADI